MNDKLKETFHWIRADEVLKDSTRVFLARKTKGYTRANIVNYKYFVSAAACLIFLLFGGHWLYFTPTAQISIDINPSLELGVNRFDRVISVTGYNDDGLDLADDLDIKFTGYTEAVNQILESETVAALLSDDELVTITVIGTDGAQSSKILSDMKSCTEHHQNAHCYFAHSDEVAEAHETGLSYGKYKALLKIQELDPSVTSDEIRDMTMKEIQDLIDSLLSDDKNETQKNTDDVQEHHHKGHGYRHD